jgi:hypothetical protein
MAAVFAESSRRGRLIRLESQAAQTIAVVSVSARATSTQRLMSCCRAFTVASDCVTLSSAVSRRVPEEAVRSIYGNRTVRTTSTAAA